MQVNIKNTEKAYLVDLSSGSYDETEVYLNSGLRLPVEHIVEDSETDTCNIHLSNGKVLTKVPCSSIDFNKDENEIALKISRGELPAPEDKPRRCCGG
mgnify:CR=1